MAYVNPYLTSDDLVSSIQLRMLFPISQQTFTYNDILNVANEEMKINAVPQVKKAHEEYFVFRVIVPLVQNIARYEIPYRSLGMTLRDLFFSDFQGNYIKMVRTAPEDKAFFQNNYGNNQNTVTYYLEGNNVVLSSQIVSQPTGNLNFFIYLRPNMLVANSRAATIQGYLKNLNLIANPNPGDFFTITTEIQTPNPVTTTLTMVNTTPTSPNQVLIGANAIASASAISMALNSLVVPGVTSTVLNNVVTVNYTELSSTFLTSDQSTMTVDNSTVLIQFDQLPSTWTDPVDNETTPLYYQNELIDFLQTEGGHSTYAYDVPMLQILPGNIAQFPALALQGFLNNNSGGPLSFLPIQIGDYICPQNECIIPQIPSELHYPLAERCAAFIQKAMGDADGYNRSIQTITQMNDAQSTIIDSRITGSVPKVFNPNNLLRSGKSFRRWRF